MVVKNVTVSDVVFTFNDSYTNTPGFPIKITFLSNVNATIPSERLYGPNLLTFLDGKLQTGEFQLVSESIFDPYVFRPTTSIPELNPPGLDRMVPRWADPFAAGGGGGTSVEIENRILSPGEIAAKSITLLSVPAVGSTIFFKVSGGNSLIQGTDFSLTIDVVSWLGFPLENLIASGEAVTFIYNT